MVKKLFLMLSLPVLALTASAKKEKVPELNIVEWAQANAELLPEERDGVRIYRINGFDDKGDGQLSTIIDMEGVSRENGFVAAMLLLIDEMDTETDSFEKIDFDNKKIVVYREVAGTGEGKNAAKYCYRTMYSFDDNIMSVYCCDIEAEVKEFGLVPRKLAVKNLKPATNERHKAIIEKFALLNSSIIDRIAKKAASADLPAISHWDDIRRQKVVVGMIPAEVMLIGGRPRSVTNSGSRTQWMFTNDFVVIFTDGVVSNVMQ